MQSPTPAAADHHQHRRPRAHSRRPARRHRPRNSRINSHHSAITLNWHDSGGSDAACRDGVANSWWRLYTSYRCPRRRFRPTLCYGICVWFLTRIPNADSCSIRHVMLFQTDSLLKCVSQSHLQRRSAVSIFTLGAQHPVTLRLRCQ